MNGNGAYRSDSILPGWVVFAFFRFRLMKFSIVTPSFKQPEWLRLCLASVADQRGDCELEHIVQDNCSGETVRAVAAEFPDVQLIEESDKGMYDAVNRGLRRATGSICAYLNCDEQYLPGVLGRVAAYFDEHPEVDVLFGDSIVADSSLMPVAYRRVVLPRRWHTLVRPLGVLTCSTFFRRKIVDEGVLFDPAWKIIGDKAWILALLDRGYRMAVLHEPLAVFVLTGVNLSHHQGIHAERLRWNQGFSPLIRLAKPLVVLGHVVEKWKQGAYRARHLTSAWYTPDSHTIRHNFAQLTLGWKWPSITGRTL
jgi:glycosyltransferase involved in cell wall biosynthesis